MQADIQAKNAARQALVDDLEARKPTKTPDTPAPAGDAQSRAGTKGRMSGSGTPGATPGLRDLEVDDMDADGEDDEGSYAATPAARTAAEGETPRYASGDDADAYGEDDDDDLFGDADADGEDDGTGGEAGDLSGLAAQAVSGPGGGQLAGTPGVAADDDADGDTDGEEDEDDPMAAMLREELGEMAAVPGTPMDQDARDAASRDILDQFAAASNADAPGSGSPFPAAHASSPAMDYSAVEGGVGMRRLAEGVTPDDDEEESSDDSSDDD